MFPDFTQFRRRKISIFYLKTKDFHSKIPQKTTAGIVKANISMK